MTTFQAVGKWVSLDDDGHEFRFLKFNGEVVGGVFKHRVLGSGVECEPGFIQWQQIGDPRPLFRVVSRPGQALSLTPFVVCHVCGDAGYITNGKWIPKEDQQIMLASEPSLTILVEADDESDGEYDIAIRRDLGDTVPEEEVGADRRLYDMRGGPPVITSDEEEEIEKSLASEADYALPRDTQAVSDWFAETLLPQVKDQEGNIVSDGFRLQDSGVRREYESGAVRDRPSGKGRYDQLQWMGLHRIALVLEAANVKYGDARNYEKGMPLHEYIDSAVRHLAQYMNGETDEDHLAQAGWNILSALQTEQMIAKGILPSSLDDRPDYYGRD